MVRVVVRGLVHHLSIIVAPCHRLMPSRITAIGRLVPSRWFLVDDFPLTGSCKIQEFKRRVQWMNGVRFEL